MTRARSWFAASLASLAVAKKHPWEVAAYLVACTFAVVTVAWPLSASRYPAMTDLPFHTAQASTIRHWFDGSYHFREQFEFRPLAVPYVSSYLIAALLMFVMPALPAMKLTTGLMLLTLPAGLGVLAWGMRKSPLLGVAGLPFIWCDLTHWGFINFVSAVGLFAMSTGLALRMVDRPSRRTGIALSLSLIFLLFTHVYRFPFAVAAVVGAMIVAYPATKRWKPIVLPLVPPLLCFGAFTLRKDDKLGGSLGPMTIQSSRLQEIPTTLVNGFQDPREMASAITWLKVVAAVAVVSVGLRVGRAVLLRVRGETETETETETESTTETESETAPESDRRDLRALFDRHFTTLVTLVPLACAVVFFLAFLTMPMEIGLWWYVYPREIMIACFIALGCLPDLPRHGAIKTAMVFVLGFASLGLTRVVADGYAQFGRSTEDFHEISELVPRGPRLLYLVFDHSGSNRTNTPYIHLPAYIQADKGGWLSFHFAVWGTGPIRYRSDKDAVVPPPVPLRWEWTPNRFDLKTQGPFFDWFLVRATRSPDGYFAGDPQIVPVGRRGSWWLYRRDATIPGAPPPRVRPRYEGLAPLPD